MSHENLRHVRRTEEGAVQLWKEQGHAPCFVMEMTSRSTWLEDHGNKKAIYAMLGVREYFLFDPEGVSLHPALQGYRLGDDGDYHRLEPDADGVFEAQTLGLELWLDDELRLQARDAATGEIIARPEAVRVEREALARECDAVTRQRDALAARLAELEARVAAPRASED
ncbi:MAG: Uma2 family endonuclease [Polyangiaceae bacterium]